MASTNEWSDGVLSGPTVILILKIAVAAVTVLLAASLIALLRGRYRLHGQINFWFMVLTLATVVALEVLVQLVDRRMFDYFDADARRNLRIHLCFAVPSLVLIPTLWQTGRNYRETLHYALGLLFLVTWTGTAITGIFFLPHTPLP